MDRTEIMNLIANLRIDIDNAESRESLIDRISEAVNTVYDANDTLSNSNAEYVRANEQLRSANMKLFTQIGAEPVKTETKPQEEEPKKLSFDDLFNEKGELK